MTTFFKKMCCDQIPCRFAVHIAHTFGPRPQLLKECDMLQYHWSLLLKLIIEKIATTVNNDNFYSNKRNLSKPFAVSLFKCPIHLLLNQLCRKSVIFYYTTKTCSKTDYRENCNQPPWNKTIFSNRLQFQTIDPESKTLKKLFISQYH